MNARRATSPPPTAPRNKTLVSYTYGTSAGESTCSTGNSRSFDAWGNVINGSTSGDPKGRYCANLGHKQDDESGLIYMRARYEDPITGRFVSEDSSKAGTNWFAYCVNEPVGNVDQTGNAPGLMWTAFFILMEEIDKWIEQSGGSVAFKNTAAGATFVAAMNAAMEAFSAAGQMAEASFDAFNAGSWAILTGEAGVAAMITGAALAVYSMALMAVGVSELYSAACSIEILADEME